MKNFTPYILLFSSVQFSHSVMSDSLRPHELQHTRPPCPSPTPGVHSDSRPSSQWCDPAISSSVIPFSSCPQSLSASLNCNTYVLMDQNSSLLKVKVPSDFLQPHGQYSPWNSPGQNTRVGSISLLQGIFPNQGWNQDFLYCRWILYQLSYQGSPIRL